MADRDDDDRALMLPPPVRKSNFYSGSSGAFRRNIISEEKYVASLEKIIERDYFPDLQEFNSRHADSEDSDVVDVTQLNVDSFLASFTTEDNESFEELQNADMQARRQKYPWLYENTTDGRIPGMLMLYYLGQGGPGSRDHLGNVALPPLTETQRANMQRLLLQYERDCDFAGSSSGGTSYDRRPAAPESWAFQVRNTLMFPAEAAIRSSVPVVSQTETGAGAAGAGDEREQERQLRLIALEAEGEFVHALGERAKAQRVEGSEVVHNDTRANLATSSLGGVGRDTGGGRSGSRRYADFLLDVGSATEGPTALITDGTSSTAVVQASVVSRPGKEPAVRSNEKVIRRGNSRFPGVETEAGRERGSYYDRNASAGSASTKAEQLNWLLAQQRRYSAAAGHGRTAEAPHSPSEVSDNWSVSAFSDADPEGPRPKVYAPVAMTPSPMVGLPLRMSSDDVDMLLEEPCSSSAAARSKQQRSSDAAQELVYAPIMTFGMIIAPPQLLERLPDRVQVAHPRVLAEHSVRTFDPSYHFELLPTSKRDQMRYQLGSMASGSAAVQRPTSRGSGRGTGVRRAQTRARLTSASLSSAGRLLADRLVGHGGQLSIRSGKTPGSVAASSSSSSRQAITSTPIFGRDYTHMGSSKRKR